MSKKTVETTEVVPVPVTNTHSTVTFTDKDGLFEFTVKKELIDTSGSLEGLNLEEIMVNKQAQKFLHNPNGPAVRYKNTIPKEVIAKLSENPSLRKDGDEIVSFWLDGQLLTDKTLEKFLHDISFKSDFRAFVAGN